MIKIYEGNLLLSDCTVLAHQSNCFSTMGAGIADEIKKKYPEAYESDKRFKLPPRERLGKFSFAMNEEEKRMIFNLYGQFRFGRGKQFTEHDKLKSAMHLMFQALDLAESRGFEVKLGMPYGMGAGHAGGDWETIYADIEFLANKFNREVNLYKFDPRKK